MLQYRRIVIACLAVVAVGTVSLIVRVLPHAKWVLSCPDTGIVGVPIGEVSQVSRPPSWAVRAIGRLKIAMPDPSVNRNLSNSLDWVELESAVGSFRVLRLPDVARTRDAYRDTLGDYCTLAQAMAEVCAADSRDFSWTMSWSELKRHVSLIRMARLVRLSQALRAETISKEKWEAIVVWRGSGAVCTWYTTDYDEAYELVFRSKPGVDMEWIRTAIGTLGIHEQGLLEND